MKINHLAYSFMLCFFGLQCFAQNDKIATADEKYDRYAYVDAIAIYERLAEKGYKNEQLFQKLGNAYYFNADLVTAAKWYDALFEMNPDQESEYYYRYAQALKSRGEYSKSDKMLELFNKKSGNEQRAKLFVNHKNYLEEIQRNSGRYQIAEAGINSPYSDYGSAIFNDKLVFASSRDTGGVSKKVFKWNDKAFTNLYTAERKPDGETGIPERFEKKINSKFHESTPVFTQDGKTMYFTRNNYLGGRQGRDEKKITLLKLYKATLIEGKWGNVYELPFNSDNYSVAHPALSVDEKTLYFASDMPGTLGQSDLFSVSINEDGTFGKPVNLGKNINTEGRETFPFISKNNELYFASDGRPGLGGLDIFVVMMDGGNNFGEVQNVGEPVNGPQDDFAFLIDTKNHNGYFTSNRVGGLGLDDIYRFTELSKLSARYLLVGTVTDQENGAVLVNANVRLFDEHFQLIKETVSDAEGRYQFEVLPGKHYYVRAEKMDYETKEGGVVISDKVEKTDLSIALEKRIKAATVGMDLAKIIDIPVIYFDLDKSDITKEGAFELEKILDIMIQYPKMRIDIRSHTDSRQTVSYNKALSERRAVSTRNWLINKGIDAARLTAKGYGESRLLNGCSDGVKCSEKEHQANRRSEFVILSIE